MVVRTRDGALKGEQVLGAGGSAPYYAFRGIPYAAPPLGNLRFKVCTLTRDLPAGELTSDPHKIEVTTGAWSAPGGEVGDANSRVVVRVGVKKGRVYPEAHKWLTNPPKLFNKQ